MVPSEVATAVIIPFPGPPLRGNRLTTRDRIEVLAWEEAARRSGYDRLVIGERHPQDDPQFGDLLTVYRSGEAWAAWGVARHGPTVRVWRCATGADFGDFPSIDAALRAVLAAPPSMDRSLRKKPA